MLSLGYALSYLLDRSMNIIDMAIEIVDSFLISKGFLNRYVRIIGVVISYNMKEIRLYNMFNK